MVVKKIFFCRLVLDVQSSCTPSVSSLLIFYRPSKTQTPPTPFPSRPVPCPPRSVEQLMLDLVLKNVKQTQQNNKQSKTHRFAPSFYLPSPTLEPFPLFFVVIARETMMLDRFRRGQNKQTTIKLYLHFVSPTLLARGRDPMSVRRIRRTKYSVSTRLEYVQT